MSDERSNRLEYIIEEAVPEDIPGWRFRYSKRVAEAVEAAGFCRPEQGEPCDAQVAAAVNAYRDERLNSGHTNADVHARCMRAALRAARGAR